MAQVENSEKYIGHLISEGPKIPLKFEKLIPPSWYDDEKFKRGQQFIRENYFLTILSMFLTPFTFLIVPKLDKLLSTTGIFDTFPRAVRSHLRANSKILSWMNGDIYEKKSSQYRGLFAAGATHKINAAKWIDGQIGFTQKDLAIGIFTFTAIVMSDYEYFYSLDKRKFEGFMHYWRVIGYHIGQMDEFNLFDGDAYEVEKKFQMVFRVICKPVLDDPPKFEVSTFTDLMKIASHLIPGADKDALIELFRRKYKLPEKPLTSKKSGIFVWTTIFVYDKLLKTWWISPIVRPILNYLSKIGVNHLLKMMELLGYKA